MGKQAPGPKEMELRRQREERAMDAARDERDRKLTERQHARQDQLRETVAAIPAKKPKKEKPGRKVAKRA